MSDEDWETDPDFENTLTDAERRRHGSVSAAEGLRRDREAGSAAQLSQAFSRGILTEANQDIPPAGAAKSSATQRHATDPDAVVRLAKSRAAAEKRTAEQVASRKTDSAAALQVRLKAESARPQPAACLRRDEKDGARRVVSQFRAAAVEKTEVSGRSDSEKSVADPKASERASRAQWIMAQKVAAAAGRDEALRKAAVYKAATQKSTPTRKTAHTCGALACPAASGDDTSGQAMQQVMEAGASASKALGAAGSQCGSVRQPPSMRAAAESLVPSGRRLAEEFSRGDAEGKSNEEAYDVKVDHSRQAIPKASGEPPGGDAPQGSNKLDVACLREAGGRVPATEQQQLQSAMANLSVRASIAPNVSADSAIGLVRVTAAFHLTEQAQAEIVAAGIATAPSEDVFAQGAAAEMEIDARAASAPTPGTEPPVGCAFAHPASTVQMLVGSRLLALAPDDEAAAWLPARVIAERSVGRTTQYKVSLDGFGSETDEWLEPQSDRVRPHTVVIDAKEAAAQGKREADTARLRAEGRRAEGYELHHHAMRHGKESA
jgi:hypothetical protein